MTHKIGDRVFVNFCYEDNSLDDDGIFRDHIVYSYETGVIVKIEPDCYSVKLRDGTTVLRREVFDNSIDATEYGINR